MLKSLQRRKGLERISDEQDRRVTTLTHRHVLKGLKCEVFRNGVAAEQFLQQHDLILDLGETDEKITVGRGGVNFVAEFGEGAARDLHPFGRGERDEGGLVRRADEIEFVGHGYLILSLE